MKILLVNPSQYKIYGNMKMPDYPPMGLAYLGAVLENAGHNVSIVDIDAEKITDEMFVNIAKEYDIVGFTATTPTYENALRLAELIKDDDIITILGGIHATLMPDECAKTGVFNFIVRGEGEKTMLELCNGQDIHTINGISFIDGDEVIHNPDRELIDDMDTIPFPAWYLFKHHKYSYPDSLTGSVMPVITSRGCPSNCTYCCSKFMFKRKIRFRSAKNIVDEIEMLTNIYKVKEIHFWDDNFTFNRERVFELRNEILRRGINLKFAFPNGLRTDKVDEEILKCLKEMGVYNISFGVESGNQDILNNMKKGTTLKQIENAYAISKKHGMETWGFFIIGTPKDTKESIMDTINFAKKINPDIAKFHILKPFPKTEVFDELNKKGLITEYDYSLYGMHTKPAHRLETLDENDLINLKKLAYREFYLRPSKILSHVLRMRSFERLKLNLLSVASIIKSM